MRGDPQHAFLEGLIYPMDIAPRKPHLVVSACTFKYIHGGTKGHDQAVRQLLQCIALLIECIEVGLHRCDTLVLTELTTARKAICQAVLIAFFLTLAATYSLACVTHRDGRVLCGPKVLAHALSS